MTERFHRLAAGVTGYAIPCQIAQFLSHRSFAFASAIVCHCMFLESSAPPQATDQGRHLPANRGGGLRYRDS
jgi:hypothetical protein